MVSHRLRYDLAVVLREDVADRLVGGHAPTHLFSDLVVSVGAGAVTVTWGVDGDGGEPAGRNEWRAWARMPGAPLVLSAAMSQEDHGWGDRRRLPGR